MAPTDATPSKAADGNYEFKCSLKANDVIPVHKFKSAVTGITVVIAEVEGPLVNGYFCLATEAEDDDGLPHTLEHLCFLGSEDYPYKGVLDQLANRCLGAGTNAWTDTDNTCYTLATAGAEGFLTLLPIYLDHILYPTLTEEGFVTEVHHVRDDGEDAGVVYCEMQGWENTGEGRCFLTLLRNVYPEGCGYRYETGGCLKNLRESTNTEKIRNFHNKFYRPENLTLIITGQVNPADVFEAISSMEKKIISKGPRGSFTRPWQSPVLPLEKSVSISVPYPCDQEDNGLVYIAWHGPSAVTELYQKLACSMLMKYMTETAVSPLQKEFVEIDDPLASDVTFSMLENSVTMLYLMFDNVPLDKLENVKDRLDQVFFDISEGKYELNMERIHTVLRRRALEHLIGLEDSPHETVAYMVLGDMLYGQNQDDLDQRLNPVRDLKLLEREPESFWIDLLKKYFISAASVTVRGIPSVEEQRNMTLESKNRIEVRKQELGEKGLQEKANVLRLAIAAKEKPVPKDIIVSVKIPSVEAVTSVKLHQLTPYTPDSDEQHPKFDLRDLPIQVYYDDIHTNFVYIHILMDTSDVPDDMRPYLRLVMESLLELPVQRKEKLVSYEEVVAQLEKDTITVSTNIGLENYNRFFCGLFSHTAVLKLEIEREKYERGILWVKELLYKTQFTSERLRVIATKIVNDVAQVKRQGRSVAFTLMKAVCYNNNTNHCALSMLKQQKFLTSVIEKLDSKVLEAKVLEDVENVRNILVRPSNLAAHIAFDSSGAPFEPKAPWKNLISDSAAKRKPINVTPEWSFLVPHDEGPQKSCVVGMGCVESSYLYRTVPCIRDFYHEDLAPLLVFLEYLLQCEGPMWKQLRGLGLSYGYNLVPNLFDGLLYFSLYKSSDPVGAFKEGLQIINSHLSEKVEFDQQLFEAARNSYIFKIIDKEKSINGAVTQSLLSYFKKTRHDYNRQLIKLIASTEATDLKDIGKKYISPLLDSSRTKTAIVCHPSKVDEVAKGFKEVGENLKVYQTLEDSFLNQ